MNGMRTALIAVVVATFGGGCLQIVGYTEPTLRGAEGGGSGTSSASTTASTGVAAGCSSSQECPTGDHGAATCINGVCGFQCSEGFADCDDSPGCEASTTDDKNHCGTCDTKCSAFCVKSSCNEPTFIAAGYDHTCAVLKDGSVWCWGFNQDGELGDGTLTNKANPTKIELPGPATRVAGGGLFIETGYVAHTCALLADKTVQCWGSNYFGELGVAKVKPLVPTALDLSNIKELGVGSAHTCAVDTSSNLFCWGYNGMGQIGNGTTNDVPKPVQVLTGVSSVALGAYHTCAVMVDGTLQCWGGIYTSQVSVPTPVAGLSGIVGVAGGRLHVCAWSDVGSWCWGDNAAGQLGTGDMFSSETPVALSLPNVTSFELGDYHSAALAGDDVYLWGANADGQLGTGTAISEPLPKKILLHGVSQISLGEKHTCAIVDGHAACWGSNGYGELGDGSLISRPSPTPVLWP